jgi:hypothetical protein
VTVLRAQGRQVAHQQAQFLAVVAETGLCGIGPDEQVVREENPSEFAADEIRAALVWSRRKSDTQLVLALDLTRRLPQVHAALEHGEIDLPKAMTFADWTRDLTPEQARTVCARLLPAAPGLTVGELIDALKRLAIAIDPEWAARRYRQAVTERRVVGYRDLDGTATLSGLGLPVEEAAAACARIDALARRVKRAGDLRGIDQIRADLFLRLLDGSYEGWNETAIIADMIRRPPGTGQDASAPDASPAAGDRRSRMSPADAPTDPSVPKTGGRPQPSADRPADEDARLPTSGRAGVELRVRLSTLLDLNDHPAEIPGWGPIIADRARRIARRQARAEWRFAVCDAEGRLVGTGLISRRPTGCSRRSPVHGGIVELQIPLDLLHALTAVPGLHPEWAPVISEVAAQLADAPGPHHGDRPSDIRADGRTDSHNGSRTDNGTDGHTADDPPGGEPVGEDGPARGQDRRSPVRPSAAMCRSAIAAADSPGAGCRPPPPTPTTAPSTGTVAAPTTTICKACAATTTAPRMRAAGVPSVPSPASCDGPVLSARCTTSDHRSSSPRSPYPSRGPRSRIPAEVPDLTGSGRSGGSHHRRRNRSRRRIRHPTTCPHRSDGGAAPGRPARRHA